MTFEYINKYQANSKTYWDLIITTDDWVERLPRVQVEEEDKETFAESVFNRILVEKEQENNRNLILSIIAQMKDQAIAKIMSGELTLSELGSMNTLINNSLGQYGISIESPDLEALLGLRIEDTISTIVDRYNQMTVTNEVKNVTLGVIQAISEVLGGNS
jgi:hypothetical protein